MSDTAPSERDYSKTLYLPQTDFPMRAGLPKKEPEIIKGWDEKGIYKRLREAAKDKPRYILHDGPPYANGNIHIGTGLNKILKDMVVRSMQMQGWDANYVPGWDCHGLPIEWKIEEQYRAKGKNKDDVPVNDFRRECREFAEGWIKTQTAEFRRLGVEGDFETPYTTMNFKAEAQIARELMKFAMTDQLYRGSKPVMWSVVEKTALAEAEVEYQDYESDTVWVKFKIVQGADHLLDAFVVIWTTTPWTMPGNRCVCFSEKVNYGLYEVTAAENDFGPQPGQKYLFADVLAQECADKAKVTFKRLRDVTSDELSGLILDHPLKDLSLGGYDFKVPMLEGDHVTDEAGTGFVHTAPGHGREDFENWVAKRQFVESLGISSEIPFTVGADGYYTKDAPGFGPDAEPGPARVIDDKGKKGDANKRVIEALIKADSLFARGRLKHTYPHSWRSKKPVIFRNTPQWFVHMDKPIQAQDGRTLRDIALTTIDDTRFVPPAGQNRLRGMIEARPDWVLSRQRAWGVPITVFVHKETGEVIPNASFERSDELIKRIGDAFEIEGADAWFTDGSKERFLGGLVDTPDDWDKVDDILDVWFDSGSTHSFVVEQRDDLRVTRKADGGDDYLIYLEGSDQHRGWFHSTLLESCGTRGRAPYDCVLTHGFVMDEDGRKMSKSLGNTVAPQDVINQYGADILRLWVAFSDYSEDLRIGPEILKSMADAYRKLRNTLRFMLGSLAHFKPEERVGYAEMPELERLMLHELTRLDEVVREAYWNFDYKKVMATLFNFATVDLSAFYFDIRKDALYCDAPSSVTRKSALTVIDHIYECLTKWLAPLLPFTMEEVWQSRFGTGETVHVQSFPTVPHEWIDDDLSARWKTIRQVRKVVTGALEIERREKRIGSSLEAAPMIYIADKDLFDRISDLDWAEIAITSQATIVHGAAPGDAFHLDDVHGVGVVPAMAEGTKCARSWKILPEVGSDPDYPDITPRDAQAMRELEAKGLIAAE